MDEKRVNGGHALGGKAPTLEEMAAAQAMCDKISPSLRLAVGVCFRGLVAVFGHEVPAIAIFSLLAWHVGNELAAALTGADPATTATYRRTLLNQFQNGVQQAPTGSTIVKATHVPEPPPGMKA